MNVQRSLLITKFKRIYNYNLIVQLILSMISNVKRVNKDIILVIINVYNVINYVINARMILVKIVNI